MAESVGDLKILHGDHYDCKFIFTHIKKPFSEFKRSKYG